MKIDYGYKIGTHDGSNPYPDQRTAEEQLRFERDAARAEVERLLASVDQTRALLRECLQLHSLPETADTLEKRADLLQRTLAAVGTEPPR